MKAEIGLLQRNCDQVCKEKQNIGTDSQCLLIIRVYILRGAAVLQLRTCMCVNMTST